MLTFNSAFLEDDQREIVLKLSEIDPVKLMKSKKIPKDLEIKIKFVRMCQCNNRIFPVSTCDICTNFVQKHMSSYNDIYRILENHKATVEEGRMFLFGDPTEDDVEVVLKSDMEAENFEELKKKESGDGLNDSFEGDCLII